MKYKITSYAEGYEKNIMELFYSAFNRVFSYDEWYWRFKTNPYSAPAIKCMWDGDLLIGHSALNIQYAWINGKYEKIAYSGTSIGKAGYVGTLPILITHLIKEQSDINFFYTAPNINSYFAFDKILRWKNVFNIMFLASRPKQCKIQNTNIKRIKFFSQQHSALVEEIKDTHSFINARNKDYLEWRYIRKPHSNYELFEYSVDDKIEGWLVLNTYDNMGDKHGQIVDIISPSPKVFKELILFALDYYYEKVALIKTWMTSPVYAGILKEMGFSPLEHPTFPLFIHANNFSSNIDYMYITMSDSDVF